jgi:hypothetical protein
MPAPPPYWQMRKQPILDEYIQASVNLTNGQYNELGHYGTLKYVGCETRDRANEIKDSLYRSARHFKVSLAYKVIHEKDDTYSVEYTVVNKAHARAYVIEKYGNNPEKWPYYHPPQKRTKRKK